MKDLYRIIKISKPLVQERIRIELSNVNFNDSIKLGKKVGKVWQGMDIYLPNYVKNE